MNVLYYFIKNHLKPVILPKYKWHDCVVTYSTLRNRDNYANIKFYATKNYVEVYIIDSSNVDFLDSSVASQNNCPESFIVPKWKIVSFKPGKSREEGSVLEFVGVSKRDYKRYKRWHQR